MTLPLTSLPNPSTQPTSVKQSFPDLSEGPMLAFPKIDFGANPPPITNDEPPIWELVISDMKNRDQLGRKKYGTPLQPNNGRDSLQDAYEEALDLAVYLRQAIYERNLYFAKK